MCETALYPFEETKSPQYLFHTPCIQPPENTCFPEQNKLSKIYITSALTYGVASTLAIFPEWQFFGQHFFRQHLWNIF